MRYGRQSAQIAVDTDIHSATQTTQGEAMCVSLSELLMTAREELIEKNYHSAESYLREVDSILNGRLLTGKLGELYGLLRSTLQDEYRSQTAATAVV